MIRKVTKNSLFTVVMLIILAFVVTFTAFYPGRPFLSWDGIFHMSRFTQIAESLKHFQLPAMVSFIGGNNNMNAMTSMYPWISNLFVIIPMMFLQPVIAIAVGILLINIITAINSYLMMRYLTNNRVYRFLGVTLYLCNSYHLIDLYAKFDFGEVTAYAFLPLIVLGLFYIWDDRKNGMIILSLGIIGVANAHLLSLFFTIIVIALIEFCRICIKKITVNELKSFVLAALLSFLGSMFSLLQMAYISVHNSLYTPSKGWNQVILTESFNDMIGNQFHEYFGTWNLGIVMSTIIIFLVGKLVFSKNKVRSWDRYTVVILVLLLLFYNIFPVGNLMTRTFMGLLQYPGRLFILVVILVIIAFTKYCNAKHIDNMRIFILMMLAIMTACGSISSYSNTRYDNSRRGTYPLTSKDFNRVLNTKTGLMDYVPKAMFNEYLSKDKSSRDVRIHKVVGNYKKAEYRVLTKNAGEKKLPLAYINGVRYLVNVNNKTEKPKANQGQMTVYLRKGNNLVRISSITSDLWYVIFGISMVTIFFLTIYGLRKLYRDILIS